MVSPGLRNSELVQLHALYHDMAGGATSYLDAFMTTRRKLPTRGPTKGEGDKVVAQRPVPCSHISHKVGANDRFIREAADAR